MTQKYTIKVEYDNENGGHRPWTVSIDTIGQSATWERYGNHLRPLVKEATEHILSGNARIQ